MGYERKVERETTASLSSSYSSLSEALLFATMCIIGLPVDVQVKDGSVYSGIFHTASVDNQYGIVLKKARMTKKGESNANAVNGGLIETLVILSDDLVQVVAEGVQLPSDHVTGNIAGDNGEAVVPSSEHLVGDTKKLTKFNMDKRKINQKRQNDNGFAHGFTPEKAGKENGGRKVPANCVKSTLDVEHVTTELVDKSKTEEASGASFDARQVGDFRPQEEQDNYKQKSDFQLEERADEEQGSSLRLDASPHHVSSTEEGQARMAFKLPNGVSHDPSPALVKPDNQCRERPDSAGTSLGAISSGISTSSSPIVNVTPESHPNTSATSAAVVPPQNSAETNKSSKDFKLNPGAKDFSPSFANPIPATTPVMPTVTSMAYVPSNSPVVAVAGGQPEVGISPVVSCSSAPTKFIQYSNLTAGNGGSGSQFSQPNVGHMVNRTHPLRYAAQYHPVQAGPAYANPNSQAVMIGRLGQQLFYFQPVSHDLVQGAAAISPVPARPPLTPQVQYPKHQGTATGQAVPLCMPQPFVSNGQQPFLVPSHFPVLQPPFPANRPIPVPGSNGLYGTKFP